MPLDQIDLPYHLDSAPLFEKIHQLPGAVFLDSCAQRNKQGRYDILTALPYLQLESYPHHSFIHSQGKTEKSQQAPFDILKALFTEESKKHNNEELDKLPFSGGAIGTFSYELHHASLLKSAANSDKAQMSVGFYDVFIIVDHQTQRCTAYSIGNDAVEKLQELLETLKQPAPVGFFSLKNPFKKHLALQRYNKDFASIQELILSGDCYQINYTQRFETHYSGDPWFAYKKLRQSSPAPFSAYINSRDSIVLCHSPEQFLELQKNLITSKPIKGTRARKTDTEADEQQKAELIKSEKDRAENVMIVDLLRNDISRNAKIGSVKVPTLFNLESYANVHHLVSTITATLATKSHAIDLFRDSFPGGSITGAPKIRAMEIINELEATERRIYCGSIAYFSFNGKLDSNITIRSLLCEQVNNEGETGNIYCWGGGGIVADSTVEEEYQESIDKIANLLQTLEQEFAEDSSRLLKFADLSQTQGKIK